MRDCWIWWRICPSSGRTGYHLTGNNPTDGDAYLQGRQPAPEIAFPRGHGPQEVPQYRGCRDNLQRDGPRSVRMWTTRRRGRCRLWQPRAEDIAAPLMFFGCEGRQAFENTYVKEDDEPTCRWLGATQTLSTFSTLVFRHSQSEQPTQFVRIRIRTFKPLSDFDNVWEWHTGGKVETNKFNNQPLDRQQPLSVLFDNLMS
jgi:hypothetical protein